MAGKMIAEKDGVIGWMIFDNSERRNAVNLSMWRAIPEILDDFEADDEIRIIVLRGVGDKAFVAGADISEFERNRASADAARAYGEISSEAQRRLYHCVKPTIAMIHGFCVGGGVGVALTCDMRLAGESATFAIPAARLGVGYSAAHIKKLIDTVGTVQAKEIFYTARRYNAQEAFRIGLVNHVAADTALDAEVRRRCSTIAANAPLTISSVKRIIAELNRPDAPPDLEFCEKLDKSCFDSEDYVEGRRAFMEKRAPVFRGR